MMSNFSSSELSALPLWEVAPPNLQFESRLRHLSLYDCMVESSEPGQIVAEWLKAHPLMPGVILTEQGQLLGMISRRRFLEQLSRPYGLELFLQRPLKALYRFTSTALLVLSGETSIVEAARRALARSPELVYEPVVVELAPHQYKLLDLHQLLVAQSQIHELATQLLNETYRELDAAHKELKRQASLDGLTQVANRRRFDHYLKQEWLQMARLQQPLSLIMADVDCFKSYNDCYGHQAGDECLQQVAAAMTQAVGCGVDATLCTSLVARYGGEEFVVVLPQILARSALEFAEKIRSQVKALKIPHSRSPVSKFVTLSLGVAWTIPDSKNSELCICSPETLIAVADSALYQAKHQGRDRAILSGCCL